MIITATSLLENINCPTCLSAQKFFIVLWEFLIPISPSKVAFCTPTLTYSVYFPHSSDLIWNYAWFVSLNHNISSMRTCFLLVFFLIPRTVIGNSWAKIFYCWINEFNFKTGVFAVNSKALGSFTFEKYMSYFNKVPILKAWGWWAKSDITCFHWFYRLVGRK